jgi:hypothetical protein
MNPLHVLIPLLVPMLLAGVKWTLPLIPRAVIPILAPIVGAGLEVLGWWVGQAPTPSPLQGALLGALGVFVREVYDQLRKSLAPTGGP